MSLDCSVGELSGSFCSTVENSANVCDSAPRLIPTPSIPALDADECPGDVHSGMSSMFTSQEMTHIMKAEKLVGKLRHRFDCQPERMNHVRDSFNLWLRNEISTNQLDASVRREITGDHPDDSSILESFQWFVAGSMDHQQEHTFPSHSQSPTPSFSEESDSLVMQ